MHRLLVSLAAAAAVLTAAAAGLFFVGGTGGVVSGSVLTVLTVPLWLAVFGLSRDPEARAAVEARMATARGEERQVTPAPAAVRRPDEPVTVEDEPTQGFTVAGRPAPQDRRRKGNAAGRRR